MSQICMPLAEVADRLTIARLKYERLPDEDGEMLARQVAYYEAGIDPDNRELLDLIAQLADINGQMWDAEAAIRQGQDANLGLEEIGRRALRIRDLNRERIAIKNRISHLANDGMADVKVNYAKTTDESPA